MVSSRSLEVARYVYFWFTVVLPIVNSTRNVHAFCLLRAQIVKKISRVGADEALMADICRMGLVFKEIVLKSRIIYIHYVLRM